MSGDRDIVPRSNAGLAKEWTVRIEISTRHGALGSEQRSYLHDKAEKLQKYFGRIMAIEMTADHEKHSWDVEICVSAEHKHDFVAKETANSPEAAVDQCVHKIEQQLRKYKEQVQSHKGEPRAGDTSSASAEPV